MKLCKVMLCVMGIALGSLPAAATDATLTFKFSKVNVPGAMSTEPGGINNAGVTVGLYFDRGGTQHGYILDGNKLTKLDDPKAAAGTTNGSNLNPDGAISVVGSYTDNRTSASVGFLYKGGKYTDIPGPKGATAVSANAINDSGVIVGSWTGSSGLTHGFILQGKKYTSLDVPGATSTVATGINKSGKIVLYWLNSNGAYESSLYDGKTYKPINVKGAANSFALDVNAAGDVCYEWVDASNVMHGALLHAGKYYMSDYPGSTETYGGGINDKNMIVGGYQTPAGGTNWFGFKAVY